MEAVFIVLLVIAAIFVVRALKVVPQQHAWVVERLGKFHATLTPGLNILVAGGGGAGKTATANALLLEVTDLDEHVVVIEAEPELAVTDRVA